MENGYSMKEIADKIGVNKMKVYRAIKKLNITEQYESHNTLFFSVTDMNAVIKEIEGDSVNEASVTSNDQENSSQLIEILKERLSKQDQLIEQQQEQLKTERAEYRKELDELKATNNELTQAVLNDNKELHDRLGQSLTLQHETNAGNSRVPENAVIIGDSSRNKDHNSVTNDTDTSVSESDRQEQNEKPKKRSWWPFGNRK